MIRKKVLDLPLIKQWKKGEGTNYFSLFDYVSVTVKEKTLELDHWIAISELFLPNFILVKEAVFLEECFQGDQDAYQKYIAEGMNSEEIEYWLNMICLDGLFYHLENLDDKALTYLSEKIKLGWELKLKNEFPDKSFKVLLLKDDSVGDFMITCQQHSRDPRSICQNHEAASKDNDIIVRPNIKETKISTNTITGKIYKNKEKIRPAESHEIPR